MGGCSGWVPSASQTPGRGWLHRLRGHIARFGPGRVMFETNCIVFGLAVGSSVFIGSCFIIKKKGLQRAGASGTRANLSGWIKKHKQQKQQLQQ